MDNYTPASKFNYVALLGSVTSATKVSRDGATLVNVADPGGLSGSGVDAWYWNQGLQIVFIKINDDRPDSTITVNY
jgi:hypothetical protein